MQHRLGSQQSGTGGPHLWRSPRGCSQGVPHPRHAAGPRRPAPLCRIPRSQRSARSWAIPVCLAQSKNVVAIVVDLVLFVMIRSFDHSLIRTNIRGDVCPVFPLSILHTEAFLCLALL